MAMQQDVNEADGYVDDHWEVNRPSGDDKTDLSTGMNVAAFVSLSRPQCNQTVDYAVSHMDKEVDHLYVYLAIVVLPEVEMVISSNPRSTSQVVRQVRLKRDQGRRMLKGYRKGLRRSGVKFVSTVLQIGSSLSHMLPTCLSKLDIRLLVLTAHERSLHTKLKDSPKCEATAVVIDDLKVSNHGDAYVTSSGTLMRKPSPNGVDSAVNLLADYDEGDDDDDEFA